MYYIYSRASNKLVAKFPLGTESILNEFPPSKYEVVIHA